VGLKRAVVLLDALGTLVNLEPPVPRLQQELLARFGLSVSEAEAQRAMAQEIAYYRAHLDEGRDQPGLLALRRRCAEVLRGELPGACAVDAEALVEALLASLHFTAFEDAGPALDCLRESGLRLVVVSNWDTSLPGVLERLGLAAGLDAVLTSAEVGARKPRPEIFKRALAVAEAEPGQAVHVGDSIEEDVAGARAAGIEAVLVRRGAGAVERAPVAGVTTISTLRELPRLLSR
jgi:putative hydrolase of the HAD superfamily